MSAKKSALFVKLPAERALVWEGLSFFQRLLGSELFREFQEREHTVGADWKRAVCARLGVPGLERSNVYKALQALADAGVLIISGGALKLLYGQEAFDAHTGSAQGQVGGQLGVSSGSGGGSARSQLGVSSQSARGQLAVSIASSQRDDSIVPGEIDREIDRENARERARGRQPDSHPPEPPNPGRFRWELEELVRAEFTRRGSSAQKASDKQWRDGCQTVQEALDLGAYPDARAAMLAFAGALVDACAGGEKLGFALQQVQLGAQLKPALAGGRQLSELAQRTLQRRAEGS